MIHAHDTTKNGDVSATDTTRIIRRGDLAPLTEDLADQADLERERFVAGWNAATELHARLARHDGHKNLAALMLRQKKAE